MSAPAVVTMQATHVLDKDALREWLAGYGLAPRDVESCSINIGLLRGGAVSAWLDVVWFKQAAGTGNRYTDDDQEAARGCSSIPLHSWPPLTPVEPREPA